ncbi:alpha-hydroxy-acid oxidizing protein [Streptomyces sp. SBC-4]|nr:alpha-hydroxy-acid oxidizing protein [Streptomyces sp. SBC-4]MDV5143152.1 alpha-hydroxy-acid oxidizing protein [Streptomyces sp. SBC-4]
MLTVDAPRPAAAARPAQRLRTPRGHRTGQLTGGGFDSPSAHALAEFDPPWTGRSSTGCAASAPCRSSSKASSPHRTPGGRPPRACRGSSSPTTADASSTAPGHPHRAARVAEAVGRACPVLLDGGVRRGTDVLAALALGDAVLLGRPALHGLAVAGADGVGHVLGIVRDELTEAMATGTGTVADAGPPSSPPPPSRRVATGEAGVPARPSAPPTAAHTTGCGHGTCTPVSGTPSWTR